ncbi:MAG: outer membrane protein assembly factor BamD [Alphaproteobacteria bacterium CG11_big_fil_rev_8_21_14_0_20_39_49]|nr:MAG: outer membrane protein assembly factor BamD [Alphaproteobacteria bacterium CG11_big_fil_rev_8_21_14_0_20_39_49]
MDMNFFKIFSLIACIFLITSCSVLKKKDEVEEVISVEAMYNKAITNLDRRNYDEAIEGFEEVERTYPYSKWATKSQIMSAYSSFKDEQYDDALLKLERFTKLHPGNEDVAYAYYLRALSFYRQISTVDKDQGNSIYARSALQEVISRFPNSRYANDARLKLDLVVDHLAGKEVNVGRFYLKQGNTIAAINRFQNVIKDYQTTSHVPEALHRLVEAYTILGVREEAVKYGAVLGYNFPDSPWYAKTYRILEGKKLTADAQKDIKGKWYDFSSWGSLDIFSKTSPKSDDTQDLSDEIDGTVKGDKEEKIWMQNLRKYKKNKE